MTKTFKLQNAHGDYRLNGQLAICEDFVNKTFKKFKKKSIVAKVSTQPFSGAKLVYIDTLPNSAAMGYGFSKKSPNIGGMYWEARHVVRQLFPNQSGVKRIYLKIS